jgi:hypothetical protein
MRHRLIGGTGRLAVMIGLLLTLADCAVAPADGPGPYPGLYHGYVHVYDCRNWGGLDDASRYVRIIMGSVVY